MRLHPLAAIPVLLQTRGGKQSWAVKKSGANEADAREFTKQVCEHIRKTPSADLKKLRGEKLRRGTRVAIRGLLGGNKRVANKREIEIIKGSSFH